MKISELSKKTGVSQRMLRYFEQEGLLDPSRNEADYRDYNFSDEERVLEICEWQRLGLTLKEIRSVSYSPATVEQTLALVLEREKEIFVQKERSLRDLRERLTGSRSPYFSFRVAHPIPNAAKVLLQMESLGWKNVDLSYALFSNWKDETDADVFLFGEINCRSAFYLLAADNIENKTELDFMMRDFCSAARTQWPTFDASAPNVFERSDLGDFFGPNEIIIILRFKTKSEEILTLLLPYQSLFAQAHGEFAKSEYLK